MIQITSQRTAANHPRQFLKKKEKHKTRLLATFEREGVKYRKHDFPAHNFSKLQIWKIQFFIKNKNYICFYLSIFLDNYFVLMAYQMDT